MKSYSQAESESRGLHEGGRFLCLWQVGDNVVQARFLSKDKGSAATEGSSLYAMLACLSFSILKTGLT